MKIKEKTKNSILFNVQINNNVNEKKSKNQSKVVIYYLHCIKTRCAKLLSKYKQSELDLKSLITLVKRSNTQLITGLEKYDSLNNIIQKSIQFMLIY